MARSQITRFFNSPFLQVYEDDREYFLFPEGTDRNEIIDTLENYLEFIGRDRVNQYEIIGDVLNSNCFREWSDPETGVTLNVSFGIIEVEP